MDRTGKIFKTMKKIIITLLICFLLFPALINAGSYGTYNIEEFKTAGEPDLSKAITKLGSTLCTLNIPEPITVTDPNAFIPETLTVHITKSGEIDHDPNCELFCHGQIVTDGSYRIFGDPNHAWVHLGVKQDKVLATWFGADSNIVDNANPLTRWVEQQYGKKILPYSSDPYIISKQLNVIYDDQEYEFEKGACIKLMDSMASPDPGVNIICIFRINGCNGGIYRNICVDGNKANNTPNKKAHGIIIRDSENITLYDPVSSNVPTGSTFSGGDGILIYTDGAFRPNNISIYNPRCINNGRNGITVQNGSNVYIKNAYSYHSDGSGLYAVDYEIEIDPNGRGYGLIVDGGYSYGGQYGLGGISNTIYPVSFDFHDFTIENTVSHGIIIRNENESNIQHCTINHSGQYGIRVYAVALTSPYNVSNCIISENFFNDTVNHSIEIEGLDETNRYAKNLKVINNVINHSGAGGIVFSYTDGGIISGNTISNGTGTSISLSRAINYICSENKVSGGTHGIQTYGGVSLCTNGKIINNMFSNGANDAIELIGQTFTEVSGNTTIGYAYSMNYPADPNSYGNKIYNNTFRGASSGVFKNLGTPHAYELSGNIFDPNYALRGSVTLDTDRTTTVTNKNVLTNSSINLEPTNADARYLLSRCKYYISKTNLTSFTINIDPNTISGTPTFDYIIR
jgi:parallel beta-helix repeat protein